MTITFGEPADLHVLHADSIAHPSWLSTDFTALSGTVPLSGPVSGAHTICRSLTRFMSGDGYTLLDNDSDTGGTGPMHGIAALTTGGDGETGAPISVTAAGPLPLAAMGAAGVGLRRRG